MSRNRPIPRRPFLSRHHLEALARRAWEQATDEERQAYMRYLDDGPGSLEEGPSVEIPLSFAAYLVRRRRKAG